MKKHLTFWTVLFVTFYPLLSQENRRPEKTLFTAEIFFDFGRHNLRPDADSTLSKVVRVFQENPASKIRITAHTDSIGTKKNNQALSERRAETISYALAKRGIPARALHIEVFGEVKPVANNSTDIGRQLNRRATIEVVQDVTFTKLEGKVSDPNTGKGIEADVVIHSKDFRDSTHTNDEGYWHVNVPEGAVVGVDVFAKGYFFESKMLKVLANPPKVVTELKPAEAGASADIQNLYFVGNQAVLLEKSKPELPKVLRFMQVNQDIRIEIAGHVNHPNRPPVAKESWEFSLSEARAKMIYDYLLENGIPAERITWKGYGNWEMKFPNATNEEQMALNRRVEIRVHK